MKRNLMTIVSLMSLATMTAFTSCTKEEATGNGSQFRATMEGCNAAKTELNGTALEWVGGDRIAVYGTAGAGIYSATPQTPATMAVFDNVSGETGDGPFRAFYPATLTTDGVNITLPSTQTYVEGSINEFPMYAESNDNQLAFKNLCGVLKLHLTKANTNISSITVTANAEVNGDFAISFVGGVPTLSYEGNGTNSVTLACATAQAIAGGRDFYIALPAFDSLKSITLTTDDGRVCTKTVKSNVCINVERSTVTEIAFGENDMVFAEPLPEGALPGLFPVSETQQVRFSQGNLQYQASTQTWRFAENQYDYVGADNANISATYGGCIDLFGWGTGGNPTLASLDNNDYRAFTDWGSNAISNAANSGWRTLTQAEWDYVFNIRANTTNLGTANARYAKGMVNNIHGVILFPDGYTHPDGVTVPVGINSTGTTGWSGNSYTLAQWAEMEAAGAVFLPAAGGRWGTFVNINTVGVDGFYWSSTPNGAFDAYSVDFYSSSIYPGHHTRFSGLSVRLVRDNN